MSVFSKEVQSGSVVMTSSFNSRGDSPVRMELDLGRMTILIYMSKEQFADMSFSSSVKIEAEVRNRLLMDAEVRNSTITVPRPRNRDRDQNVIEAMEFVRETIGPHATIRESDVNNGHRINSRDQTVSVTVFEYFDKDGQPIDLELQNDNQENRQRR